MASLSQQHVVTVNLNGGSWGSGDGWSGSAFWAGTATWEFEWMPFYNQTGGSADYTLLSRVKVPTRPGYRFVGIGSDASHILYLSDGWLDTSYPSATGDWLSGCTAVQAFWSMTSVPMVFNQNGGSQAVANIYYSPSDQQWFSDIDLTTVVYSLTIPDRSNYVFAGYYSAQTGGVCYVDAAGRFTDAFLSLHPSNTVTVYAHWIDVSETSYRLTFDANGGSTPTAYKTVSLGYPVGTLPVPTKSGACFKGWQVDGRIITDETVWTSPAAATAVAVWGAFNGYVKDWFGLASAAMVPIASDDGDNKKRVCVTNAVITGSGANRRQSNAGRFSSGVSEIGGIWRNPSVTYRVIRDCTVSVNLGRAYAKTGSTISGFMITSVEVKKQIGEYPTVTVSAVANEGADAINIFAVSIPVTADAHAQNLLSAISGGGELQSMTMTAVCDPVVCEEANMPCASDVVKGRYVATGETLAAYGEAAPVGANGFVATSVPAAGGDGVFPSFAFTAQKEIV